MERDEAEKMLRGKVGNVVRVNCYLGSCVSELLSMMYVGEGGGQHYFVRSFEQTANVKEVFNGVRVPSNEENVRLNEDNSFTLYGVSGWPREVLDIYGTDFNRVRLLWDAFLERGVVNKGEGE
jgi:hypothetical protein